MSLYPARSIPLLLASILSLSLVAEPAKAQWIYLDAVMGHTSKAAAAYYLEPGGADDLGRFTARIFTMDGALKAMGSYSDDTYRLADGHFVFYHPNGLLESEGIYRLGRKDGVWARRDANGHALAERVYDASPLRDLVYTLAQTMPRFPGGEKAMVRHIEEKVGKAHGQVLATFIVEKDGQISGLEVLGAKAPQEAEQIASAISTAPRWEAGMQDGQPVRVQMRVPIE